MPFTVWSTGQTVSAADFNSMVQQQVISTWTNTTTRDAGISSPQHGQFAFTEDANKLWYYNSSAWVEIDLVGDISSIVTASNSSLAGGATSGAATLTVAVNNSTTATATAADYVLISDTDASNSTKKALISDITALVTGDITAVTVTAPITGGGSSGSVGIGIDQANASLILHSQVFG